MAPSVFGGQFSARVAAPRWLSPSPRVPQRSGPEPNLGAPWTPVKRWEKLPGESPEIQCEGVYWRAVGLVAGLSAEGAVRAEGDVDAIETGTVREARPGSPMPARRPGERLRHGRKPGTNEAPLTVLLHAPAAWTVRLHSRPAFWRWRQLGTPHLARVHRDHVHRGACLGNTRPTNAKSGSLNSTMATRPRRVR